MSHITNCHSDGENERTVICMYIQHGRAGSPLHRAMARILEAALKVYLVASGLRTPAGHCAESADD